MSLDDFWRLTEEIGGYPPVDEHGPFRRLEDALASRVVEDIFGFADTLAERLYELDRREFAEVSSINTGRTQSSDSFLHSRCAVLVAGRDVFNAILSNDIDFAPFTDSRIPSCESLLYVSEKAYERRTNKSWDHITPLSYETGSNAEGWS